MNVWAEGRTVYLEYRGTKGADILTEEGIVEGAPFEGVIPLSVSEFMELLFSLYFNRDFLLRKGYLELKKGKSSDVFLKFTNYAKRERSIFYVKNLNELIEKLEKVRASLEELFFIHDDLFVRYKDGTLELISPSLSESYSPKTVRELEEVYRFGAFTKSGFINYGVGKHLSILKPEGEIRFGAKVYPEKTDFILTDKKVPLLFTKIYLTVR